MIDFFRNEIRRGKLEAEAESWLHTPFHGHARLKRVGVDCINLAAALYEATGVCDDIRFPRYKLDEGLHASYSRIRAYLDECEWMCRRDDLLERPDETQPGDLVCICPGRVAYHVGVRTRAGIIQVMQRRTVQIADMRDPAWRRRLDSIYRAIERPV